MKQSNAQPERRLTTRANTTALCICILHLIYRYSRRSGSDRMVMRRAEVPTSGNQRVYIYLFTTYITLLQPLPSEMASMINNINLHWVRILPSRFLVCLLYMEYFVANNPPSPEHWVDKYLPNIFQIPPYPSILTYTDNAPRFTIKVIKPISEDDASDISRVNRSSLTDPHLVVSIQKRSGTWLQQDEALEWPTYRHSA